MDLHQNARLSFRSREVLAKKIMIEKVTLKAAAAGFTVSRKTAAKWVQRYRSLGLPGLRDRSSRPLHSPRRTSSQLIAQVIALRRELRPAYQIAQATGLSPATVSRILQRAQLNRWRHLHPAPPVVRYEHPAPKLPYASGPTFAITSTQRNAISSSRPGSSITTSTVRMVVSVTLRPSAARLRWVQRLDRSQPASVEMVRTEIVKVGHPPWVRLRSGKE